MGREGIRSDLLQHFDIVVMDEEIELLNHWSLVNKPIEKMINIFIFELNLHPTDVECSLIERYPGYHHLRFQYLIITRDQLNILK